MFRISIPVLTVCLNYKTDVLVFENLNFYVMTGLDEIKREHEKLPDSRAEVGNVLFQKGKYHGRN